MISNTATWLLHMCCPIYITEFGLLTICRIKYGILLFQNISNVIIGLVYNFPQNSDFHLLSEEKSITMTMLLLSN